MLKKLFWNIFTKLFLLVFAVLLSLSLYLSYSLEKFYYDQTEIELQETAAILQNLFTPDTLYNTQTIQSLCNTLGAHTNTRLTVIRTDGKVLGDSREDPELMDNHAGRPEVHLASLGHMGSSRRFSDTLLKNMFYLALPLFADGTAGSEVIAILRVARDVNYIKTKLNALKLRVYLAGTVMLSITAIVSLLIARSIGGPVLRLQEAASQYAAGNFELKTHIHKPVELASLSRGMNYMSRQLKTRIDTINTQKSKLEAILEHMVEPVILLDDDLLIQDLNHAACSVFKIKKDPSLGHSLIEIIRNIELYDCACKTRSSAVFQETQITLNYGQQLHLQVHVTPLFGKDGCCHGQLLVLNDITRLIRLENMRKEFVANVSHELKTPITAIKGFVETLQDGALGDAHKAAEFLTIIHRQTNRLDTIINDLLALSRLEESEKSGIEKATHRIGDLCEVAMRNCRPAAIAKQIDIDINGETDFLLQANGFLIEQALTNLLDNAIKYSDPTNRIKVVCGPCAQEKGKFPITVTDQGCGILPANQPHIFERFYRVDKARSRALGGTGLGLSIVKHIMLAHGGEVDVQSVPGAGSTFTLRLPCVVT